MYRTQQHKVLLICLAMILAIILYCVKIAIIDNDKFYLAKLITLLTAVTIFGYLKGQPRIILFDPLNLFCFYYMSVVLVNIYYISTDFEMTPYVDAHAMHHNYIYLFNLSCFYYFAGLVSIILGYNTIRRGKIAPIKFESSEKINPYVLYIVAIIFFAAGFANFAYNVLVFAGGNPMKYLGDIALRKYQFEESGTTIGYVFYYMGTYLLAFSYLRENRKIDLFFIGAVLGGIILWISNGRIYLTLFYILSFVALFYYNNISNQKFDTNKKYFRYLFVIPVLGVSIYFFRVISSLRESGLLDKVDADVVSDFMNSIGFYIIDKGNLPNTAIFLKIIDAWKLDHGYLYGQSLFSWIVNILPAGMRPVGYQPSVMIKEMWFESVPGGHLPPTGVAEMYMNFGPAGPFLGMFFLGVVIKVLHIMVVRSRSFWHYLTMVQISIAFVMIYSKGEFDNLNLIYVFIAYFPLLIVRLATRIFRVKIEKIKQA